MDEPLWPIFAPSAIFNLHSRTKTCGPIIVFFLLPKQLGLLERAHLLKKEQQRRRNYGWKLFFFRRNDGQKLCSAIILNKPDIIIKKSAVSRVVQSFKISSGALKTFLLIIVLFISRIKISTFKYLQTKSSTRKFYRGVGPHNWWRGPFVYCTLL